MSLVGQWRAIEAHLPDAWGDTRLRLTVDDGEQSDRAAALLGPAQPYRSEPRVLRLIASQRGTAGAGPEAIGRLLARLDDERIEGTIELVSSEAAPVAAEVVHVTLSESWTAALATVPPDWSDLFCEVELTSSDYVDRGALLLGPLNPRRDGMRTALRFRSAKTFGYGASPAMVRRCLERCDEESIRGSVQVLRALSDTQSVSTQGPTWSLAGRIV